MKITSIIPQASISRYVSSIMVIENYNQQGDFVLPLFANGSPTLVFNTAKATNGDKNISNLTLYGQTITPSELRIKNDFSLIAYFLYPSALTSLFDISAGDLTDGSTEPAFLKQAKKYNLQEQLLNTPMLNFRLGLLNNFIIKLTDSAISINTKTEFAIHKIKQYNGQIPLQNIQKEMGITERALQRLFETNVGVSPKMYSRICQFHSAFQQLNYHQFSKYSDIAFENGFADQSHFIRVFKEFTALTPGGYLQKAKSIQLEI
jgi:AraC-like DNA-binding protein